jgi:7-keto-8-aminopelargonate synthetase-like enzyme
MQPYTVRASKEEPQYLIKSDKTDHMAMHKGSALKNSRANDERVEDNKTDCMEKTCQRKHLRSLPAIWHFTRTLVA